MPETQYEERYCAFVDILGFSDLIGEIRNGKARFETVRDLLEKIHKPRTFELVGQGDADFQAQSISDAIAISTRLTEAGLGMIIDVVEQLTFNALHAGYFTRGGLCRGLLYHDQNMVFGEALVKAYHLESRFARYPRIMITKQVFDDAMESNLRGYFVDHLSQADDGPYFVNVLAELKNSLLILDGAFSKEAAIVLEKLSYFEAIRSRIAQRLAEAADNPEHFMKVQWFARYWNNSLVPNDNRIKPVQGPGLDIMTWRTG
jgi:hypothetical protein